MDRTRDAFLALLRRIGLELSVFKIAHREGARSSSRARWCVVDPRGLFARSLSPAVRHQDFYNETCRRDPRKVPRPERTLALTVLYLMRGCANVRGSCSHYFVRPFLDLCSFLLLPPSLQKLLSCYSRSPPPTSYAHENRNLITTG